MSPIIEKSSAKSDRFLRRHGVKTIDEHNIIFNGDGTREECRRIKRVVYWRGKVIGSAYLRIENGITEWDQKIHEDRGIDGWMAKHAKPNESAVEAFARYGFDVVCSAD